ncbi:ABC transporter ATP-binding protein [uncultured Sneathiella sp.]|uniref:ABC transporter ATP-binding protein n=1 Tax=uncultured Sneathiella sp. TaxID=879315 RepID=UPI0025998DC2|nr:ABC transporter ATP-binding protein [uncultured Sneathiella sp.]
MTLLALENLSVRYGGASLALEDVTFAVPESAIVALLGPNGAGKTTTLRAISGLLPFHGGAITSGRIIFDGAPLTGRSAQRVCGGIAQVMEGRRVFADLTVEENLLSGAFTRPRSTVKSSLDGVYALFPDLTGRRRDMAGLLSGGQQQMVAVGRALMSAPRLLLLDEPSLGLAPMIVQQIAAVLREINEEGASVLLVEQNAALALSLASSACILETGIVALSGPSEILKTDPKVREIYLGHGAGVVA